MTLRTLNYGNYGICLVMGNAGFKSATVAMTVLALLIPPPPPVMGWDPGRWENDGEPEPEVEKLRYCRI